MKGLVYWEAGASLFNLGGFSLSLFVCGVELWTAFFFYFDRWKLFPRSLVRRAGLRGGKEGEGVGGVPVGWSDQPTGTPPSSDRGGCR